VTAATVYVVNQGEEAILDDGLTGVAYTLRLHKTDVIAGLSSEDIDNLDEGDFVQADFTGYAAEALSTGDWTVTQGNPTVAANVEKAFTSSADHTAQSIWGYYVTRDSDGALIWFGAFSAPIVMEFEDDEINVTPTLTLDDTEANVIPTGVTVPFAGSSGVPDGWRLCSGQAVSRTTFADLFAVIGTSYGVGDGSTTFNLPDMRQKFPLGKADSGTGSGLGDTGGAIDHVHDLDSASSGARISFSTAPEGLMLRKALTARTANFQIGGVTVAGSSASTTNGIELEGDSDTENPPFQVFNYIIKT
jgi:microcystin-dependent protein